MDRDFGGIERRQYARIDAALEIRFTFSDACPGGCFFATSRDVSEGGMCLMICDRKEQVYDWFRSATPLLHIEAMLPSSTKPLKLAAVPVWTNGGIEWLQSPANTCHPLIIGIRFKNPDAEVQARLRDFIGEQFVEDRR